MLRLATLTAALLLAALPAAADNADITDIQIIPLQRGINEIPHMTPDGRDGKIVMLRREDGDALGYYMFMVLIDGKDIGVATDSGFEDITRDQPHNISDAVKSVRFAWGNVAGEKQMLLITAKRRLRPQDAPPDPAQAAIDIYQLVSNGPIGTTGDYFTRISETVTDEDHKYCNSDLVLNQKLGLPLPFPFQGPNQHDGCL
jgi:hypothetical protein